MGLQGHKASVTKGPQDLRIVDQKQPKMWEKNLRFSGKAISLHGQQKILERVSWCPETSEFGDHLPPAPRKPVQLGTILSAPTVASLAILDAKKACAKCASFHWPYPCLVVLALQLMEVTLDMRSSGGWRFFRYLAVEVCKSHGG